MGALMNEAYGKITGRCVLNSFRPGRCAGGYECVNFIHNLVNDILSIQINITLEWVAAHVKKTLELWALAVSSRLANG